MQKQIDGIEAEIRRTGPDGFLSRLIAPATDAVLRSQCMAVARHRAAEVLLAATRERLASGTLPESIDALVPARLPSVPRDPFTADAPLHLKATPDELLVWSVGPDGDDTARITRLHRLLFQRDPVPADIDRAGRLLAVYPGEPAERWGALARVLMASNEFLYLD